MVGHETGIGAGGQGGAACAVQLHGRDGATLLSRSGANLVPTLRLYRVFISHAWRYDSDYYRVEDFLDSTPNFDWENLSVPSHAGIRANDTDELRKRLRDQMRPAHAFVIIAGMYVAHSDWIDFEIEFARRIGRPIVGVAPRGSVQLPRTVQRAAAEVVGWTRDSIVGAIRRHALRDGR